MSTDYQKYSILNQADATSRLPQTKPGFPRREFLAFDRIEMMLARPLS
jgi:hypothetical protein